MFKFLVEAEAGVCEISGSKFLILDKRIIETTDNVTLKLGTLIKDSKNPLFYEEYYSKSPKLWEAKYDNLYPNVIYDNEDKLYKCWYNPFLAESDSEKMPIEKRRHGHVSDDGRIEEKQRETGICYAYSKDGVHWVKPVLGLIEFKGSRENNIVMRHAHGACVFKDLHEKDPKRRFKMFFKEESEKKWYEKWMTHMCISFSQDGINWSDPMPWPEYNAAGDTHNNAFWDPFSGKYIGITRGFTDNMRVALRTESSDFINWTNPVEVFRGSGMNDQIYSMPVFRYANVYIGLPAIFHRGEDPSVEDWDKVITELAWSPDTIHWSRACPGQQLIPLGKGIENYPNSEYDCGCIYAAVVPIIQENEILLYYGGSNYYHTGLREGSFNLAHLRPDGFAGYEPSDNTKAGFIRTKQFINSGIKVMVSADVESNGCLKAAVMDENGNGIPGYSFAECDPIVENVSDYEITWGGNNLSGLINRKLFLAFELNSAKLYAFVGE